MVLLILFWNAWLVFGFAIDIALLAVAVIRPGWVGVIADPGSQDPGESGHVADQEPGGGERAGDTGDRHD